MRVFTTKNSNYCWKNALVFIENLTFKNWLIIWRTDWPPKVEAAWEQMGSTTSHRDDKSQTLKEKISMLYFSIRQVVEQLKILKKLMSHKIWQPAMKIGQIG